MRSGGFKRFVEENRQLMAIIVVVVGAMMVVALFVVLWMNSQSQDGHDHGADEELRETLSFENQELLDFIGRERSVPIFHCVEPFIMGIPERKSAPHENEPGDGMDAVLYYRATLVEGSSGRIEGARDWSYHMDMDISDGRAYELLFKLDSDYEYVFAVLKNKSSGSGYFCVDPNQNGLEDTARKWLTDVVKIDPEELQNFFD